MSSALELQAVSKKYAGVTPVYALSEVSMRVSHGELVAVVGPSGSGKSTLLNVMGTLDRPTEGKVLLDGVDTSDLDDNRLSGLRAAKVGFIFQQFHLLPGLSAVGNVANGLLYQGVDKDLRVEKSIVALGKVGLGKRLWHNPNQLSGGERQRVAIARALVHDPAFVLADEPTGNLDSKSTRAVMDLVEELNSEGSTIVVITHDQQIAESLPRQVEVLDGCIKSDSARFAEAG